MRVWAHLILLVGLPLLAGAEHPSLLLPRLPPPRLVEDQFGTVRRIGLLWFLRGLQEGGVRGYEDLDLVDAEYVVIDSRSLPTLAAWLEAACRSVGADVRQARQGPYDGMVLSRLLEVGASLASLRGRDAPLAMPIGVVICERRRPWGAVPGDGERDAYILIATERGLLIYDPPTRQLCPLADYPNNSTVFKIQF
ncbi:MAG: hypothetical protein JSR48_09505 [Verrucomicrobia bacterium]|nr:hypothetical protein [Verrucomicrobiota bacterium]